MDVLPKPDEAPAPNPPPEVAVLLFEPNRPPPVLLEFEPKRVVGAGLFPKRDVAVFVLAPNPDEKKVSD